MTPARDQQIKALYQAALERPPAERASFVAALTGDDADLRKSVELLLSNEGATDVGARVTAATEPAAELEAGTTLGQYRVDGVLGRGGIGIVYRGTDTKLHRPVAIKFLSAAVADADARRRFKQEAETTSSLNHPHIVTVYDVGEHDGREYIVSELVDGGTLDDWVVKTGKRSWRQSVELLTGVADALAAAHAAGVLHRDVKPGNILIGSNGYAKLADFGLAKLVDVGRDGSVRPRTLAPNKTRAGVVVGTIAYMSPEQAAGLALDARSDVFSFGVVLYELVAGRRPFDGANDLETLKSIAHAAPAPLPDNTPDLLKVALDKALEKEASDRYQTMQDLVADLKRVTRRGVAGSQSSSAMPVKPQRRAFGFWAGAIGVALGAALAVVALQLLRPASAPPAKIRFTIPVPGYVLGGVSVSPDGRRITYASNAGGTPQIWLRPVDALDARPMPGTENGAAAVWSPDGRYLAFSASGRLKRVDVAAGGAAQTIADAPLTLPASWLPNGTILFTNGIGSIARVNSAGGAIAPVVTSKGAELPHVLPDGEHFVYLDEPVSGKEVSAFVGSLSNGRPVLLTKIELHDYVGLRVISRLAYATGHLLALLDGTLLSWPFDARARAIRGPAVTLAENVGEFSVSDTGVLIYHEKAASARGLNFRPRQLTWFDRDGRMAGTVDAPPGYRLPVLSPDGYKITVSVPGANGLGDLWIIDTQRGITSRLTFNDREEGLSVWSPDSTQVAFNSSTNAGVYPNAVYKHAANGSGSDELLFTGEPDELVVPFDWTGNGLILFGRLHATKRGPMDTWALPAAGNMPPYPVLQSPFGKAGAKVSPNGKWIAYSTNESGGTEVFVEPFPIGGQGKRQVSTRGGSAPKWRSNGRELYYLAPDGNVMAVDVDTTRDAFDSATPRVLFSTAMEGPSGDEQADVLFDATPDGQRFLLNLPLPRETTAGQSDTPLQVIVNWTTGLDQP